LPEGAVGGGARKGFRPAPVRAGRRPSGVPEDHVAAGRWAAPRLAVTLCIPRSVPA
jgi:hypothetical protein